MFYADTLTREKIKAGKYIIENLIQEGWDVQAAAWLLHGYTPEPDELYPGYEEHKYWCLHFIMPRGISNTDDWAFGRVRDLQKAYIDDLYEDALFDDQFPVSVNSPGESLANGLLELPPIKHPLGERKIPKHSRNIRDGFVYNLKKAATQKRIIPDSQPT